MSNLIRGEFYKLRKSKYCIGMILISIFTGLFMMIRFNDYTERLRISNPKVVNGIYSINYSFECILFTSFIFALFAGEFIAKDLKYNVSRSFIYGYERSKVILSKLIVFMLFSIFIEFIYTTILAVYTSMNYGFCEALNLSTILYLIRLILIGIMYNAATISIVAMIAVITKSNLYTIVSPILFLLFCMIFDPQIPIIYILEYLCHFIMGDDAVARFVPMINIIMGIVSSVSIFTLTIGASLVYVKHEDIK